MTIESEFEVARSCTRSLPAPARLWKREKMRAHAAWRKGARWQQANEQRRSAPQRLHGRKAGGTLRGEETGGQCNDPQQYWDSGKGKRIVRRHTEEQT